MTSQATLLKALKNYKRRNTIVLGYNNYEKLLDAILFQKKVVIQRHHERLLFIEIDGCRVEEFRTVQKAKQFCVDLGLFYTLKEYDE